MSLGSVGNLFRAVPILGAFMPPEKLKVPEPPPVPSKTDALIAGDAARRALIASMGSGFLLSTKGGQQGDLSVAPVAYKKLTGQ